MVPIRRCLFLNAMDNHRTALVLCRQREHHAYYTCDMSQPNKGASTQLEARMNAEGIEYCNRTSLAACVASSSSSSLSSASAAAASAAGAGQEQSRRHLSVVARSSLRPSQFACRTHDRRRPLSVEEPQSTPSPSDHPLAHHPASR